RQLTLAISASSARKPSADPRHVARAWRTYSNAVFPADPPRRIISRGHACGPLLPRATASGAARTAASMRRIAPPSRGTRAFCQGLSRLRAVIHRSRPGHGYRLIRRRSRPHLPSDAGGEFGGRPRRQQEPVFGSPDPPDVRPASGRGPDGPERPIRELITQAL